MSEAVTDPAPPLRFSAQKVRTRHLVEAVHSAGRGRRFVTAGPERRLLELGLLVTAD